MKKSINKENFKKGLYSAAALGLCLTALFSFWMSNRKNNLPKEDASSETSTSQVQTTKEEKRVNEPVTNIKDDRYTTTEAPSSVYFATPLENGISREFSKGELIKNATTGDWRTHNGADYKGVAGDPVKAIFGGTVTAVRDDPLWGTVVSIDHGNGITAEYRGFAKDSTLQPGDTVKINDKIGTLGEIPIEKAEGVHLHLEIYKNGVAVSPADYTGKNVIIYAQQGKGLYSQKHSGDFADLHGYTR